MVICSDKTGTLTTNQMSVTEFFTLGGKTTSSRVFSVEGTTYNPKDDGIVDWTCYNKDANLQALAEICTVCNDAGIYCEGLKRRTAVADRLATMCVLPLLLAGVLGAPNKTDQLADYLRKLLVEGTMKKNHLVKQNAEIINAVRFLCTFEQHHGMVFIILLELVVSSNMDMKINATNLLKVIVPYIDAKVASIHVMPALVTLGCDQNLSVKYASIDAFGAVA